MKWHALMMMSGVLALSTAQSEQTNAETSSLASEQVEQVFASLDRDADERISKQEAQRRADLGKRFDGVDASGDGYLSRNEYRARPSDEPFE